MKHVTIVLPNQLFELNPILDKKRRVVILEHPRYFTAFAFHQQKLVFHRASMKEYQHFLEKKGYVVEYVEYHAVEHYLDNLDDELTFHLIDPVDHALSKKLKKQLQKQNNCLAWYESPLFLTSIEWIEKNVKGTKKFLMHTFYVKQRKRLNILIDKGKPVGGKWSFDKENQKPIPETLTIPRLMNVQKTKALQEAVRYVKKHFPHNPGSVDYFIYPTTAAQAKKWFGNFLTKRFALFGTYQDAILKDESFLFHSVLSPLLNTGLLCPEYVVKKTVDYAKKHRVPINSLEGFIRQIIGWREFVRAVYHLIGEEQHKANFFNNQQPLSKSFYTGTTGIEPIDNSIKRLIKTAYSHHIERLMVLSNFMLIAQIKPNDVYSWFMEMYIDAYDWVMVPNVYGMSQYADTRMTTKPYIASSNYILTMSNYPKGDWCDLWDGLFWSFMHKHNAQLSKIPRMKFMINALHKKTAAQLKKYQLMANKWQSASSKRKRKE